MRALIFLLLVSLTCFADSLFLESGGSSAVSLGGLSLTGSSITSANALTALGAGIIGLKVLALGASILLSKVRRRGKRDTTVTADPLEPLVWDLLRTSDTVGCALKLVCFLEAKPEDKLSPDESDILKLFGSHPEALSVENLRSSKAPYLYAAFMGDRFGADVCKKLFHTCSYTIDDMMEYISSLKKL